jgi:large repetitive protein
MFGRVVAYSTTLCASLIALIGTASAAAPAVVSPYNNETIYISTTSINPTIAGTADSGSSITVKRNGEAICTTTTSTTGNWSCVSNVGFAPGTYALTVNSILGDIAQESVGVSCVIISLALATPAVVSPYNNEVLYISGSSIFPTISGTATAGTAITVKRDGVAVCTTTTNSNGQWSCVSNVAFGVGTFALTVVSTLGDQSRESAGVSCVIVQLQAVPPPIVSAVNETVNGAPVGSVGTTDVSTNDTKPSGSQYTFLSQGTTCVGTSVSTV